MLVTILLNGTLLQAQVDIPHPFRLGNCQSFNHKLLVLHMILFCRCLFLCSLMVILIIQPHPTMVGNLFLGQMVVSMNRPHTISEEHTSANSQASLQFVREGLQADVMMLEVHLILTHGRKSIIQNLIMLLMSMFQVTGLITILLVMKGCLEM